MKIIKSFYRENKTFLIIFAVALVYYTQHLISFRSGMFCEESRDANAYLWALKGNLAYRDFEWIYGPFSFMIYPLIMKVFGVNLLVLRISYIILASVVIPLAYFLARRILPHFWAGIAAFLSIVFFRLPNYTYNHVFFTLGALVCLLMLCRFLSPGNKILNLVWAGFFAAIAVLTKPLLWGISLFAAVSLFLLFLSEPGTLGKRLKYYSIFTIGTFSFILIYFLYFYSQTMLRHITIIYPYLARDSVLFTDNLKRVNPKVFLVSFRRLFIITPIIRRIIYPTSFAGFKDSLLFSFENSVFALSFIVPIFTAFIITYPKFNKLKQEIRDKIQRDKQFLSLFAVFSLFISLEGLTSSHMGGRVFTIQVPLILCVYIIYLVKKLYYSNKPLLSAILVTLFLFYLSFLNFFYHPYSFIKKYTKSMNLERARGVLLTAGEKELYESLSSYLALNLGKFDKMAVMAYMPQISFLTEKENIFEKSQYIFLKLQSLLGNSDKKEELEPELVLFEDKIISKIQREKPKIVLDIIEDNSQDFSSASPRIGDYIKSNYSLDKKFGPADVIGTVDKPWRVNLYKYKEKGIR